MMKAGEVRLLAGLGLVISLMFVGTGSYAAARWVVLSRAAAAPSPAGRAAVSTATHAVAEAPAAGRLHPPAAAPVAGPLAAATREVSLPQDLSPLDNLCLERGLPAVLLRGRVLAELRGWTQAARKACWRDGRTDRSEILIRFQVQSAPSIIRVGHIARAVPYNGAPVADDVLACVDRELRRHENSEIQMRGAGFPPFDGPVDLRLRLGDGTLCSN
jgi:hypothetical protein